MMNAEETGQALASIHTESGASLLALAEESPVLLVFLRHFGCSFCRLAIGQIAELSGEFEARSVRPVFVHMGPPEIAKATFDFYGLCDVERVNDPEQAVYHHPVFGLQRKGPLYHISKLAVWRGWFKHGIGNSQGDIQQMQGVFFLKGPKIVRKFIHRTIADEPDYLAIAN
jgi:hypothetical protein